MKSRTGMAGPIGIVMLSLLPLGSLPPAGAETEFSCPAEFAPISNFCSTGNHYRSLGISHDVTADINYVGTLESTLVWSGGKRVYRCTFTHVRDKECVQWGDWPPGNTWLLHQCRSIVPGTAIPDTPLTGIQGGVGTWSCSVFV